MHILKSLTIASSNILKHQKLINFQYTQPRSQPTRHREYRQEDRQKKHSPIRKLDPSYWEALLPTIEPMASRMVKTLLDSNSSKKQTAREMQEYLEFRNTTFTKDLRTDLGCMAVLVAMGQMNASQNLEEYESRIVDFVTLSDLNNSPYDSTMLRYLLMAIHKRSNTNVQKNIRQYYRLRLVQITLDNFQRLDNRDILLTISIIQESLQKDKMNFITKWRFFPLLQAIQSRLITLMKTYLSTSDLQVQKSVEYIITPPLYYKFLNLIFHYGYITLQDAEVIVEFCTNRETKVHSDYHVIMSMFNTLCYIPYVEYKDGEGKLQTMRKKLLAYFEVKYSQSGYYRKMWTDFIATAKRFTIQRFIEDEFHLTFKSLPFQKYEEKYLLLRKEHLVRPQLPQFLWRLFKQNEKAILDKMIVNHVVKTLYPEKISIEKSLIADYSQRKLNYFADNESNLKIWQALNNLGYQYKKEQICADRQVDLIIDDNIILEVDGEGHYVYLTNQLAPDTSFRNLHLLLSGYKLVTISMSEYNNNRSIEQLQKLLKEKIELVKTDGVVYVC